jgi:hypothetical protein
MTAFALVVHDDAETALLAFEIGLALDAAQLLLARFSGLSVTVHRA